MSNPQRPEPFEAADCAEDEVFFQVVLAEEADAYMDYLEAENQRLRNEMEMNRVAHIGKHYNNDADYDCANNLTTAVELLREMVDGFSGVAEEEDLYKARAFLKRIDGG